MATLVSPGVSVTVTDQSFYIPATAATVPLIFGVTQANKFQPDGVSIADGTNEHSVIRTITSLGQSVSLYGIPHFWSDNSGVGNTVVQHYGDCRNETGLFAMNQFLGVGSSAFFVRANIDITDAPSVFFAAGIPQVVNPVIGVRVGTGTISAISVPSMFKKPETWDVVAIGSQIGETVMSFTVTGSVSGMVGIARAGTPFVSTGIHFTITEASGLGSSPFAAGDYFEFTSEYVPGTFTGTGNGRVEQIVPGSLTPAHGINFTITFTSPTAYTVTGVDPITSSIVSPTIAGVVGTGFTDPSSNLTFTIIAGSIPFAVGDAFTLDISEVEVFNPLGVNDAQKRQAIVTALQAEINSNQDVRAETFEYNLILCPGFPEVVDEMLALSDSIGNEAFVIADVPCHKSPEQAANWAVTSERFNHDDVAYYYPWGLASNLDGVNVLVAPSGIALKTYAYSDNASYVWFAPAGSRRGVVTGVQAVGYTTGTLGQATTFVQANLNQGQRNNLYQFQANINPIVYFPGRGLLVWGQKTSASAPSARDRVNVERLICYIRRSLRKGAFPFVFEPSDKITWDDLKHMIDGFLADIRSLRGLDDFATVCDASTNTPVRIDRNELWCAVGIIPTRASEFIYIPITVYNHGAVIGKA